MALTPNRGQPLKDIMREAETDGEKFSAAVRMNTRALRRSLGLTQEEMAERLGVWGSTVSNWETHDILLSKLHDYLGALGYDVVISFVKRDEEVSQ